MNQKSSRIEFVESMKDIQDQLFKLRVRLLCFPAPDQIDSHGIREINKLFARLNDLYYFADQLQIEEILVNENYLLGKLAKRHFQQKKTSCTIDITSLNNLFKCLQDAQNDVENSALVDRPKKLLMEQIQEGFDELTLLSFYNMSFQPTCDSEQCALKSAIFSTIPAVEEIAAVENPKKDYKSLINKDLWNKLDYMNF